MFESTQRVLVAHAPTDGGVPDMAAVDQNDRAFAPASTRSFAPPGKYSAPHSVTGEPLSETPIARNRQVLVWRETHVFNFLAAMLRVMGLFERFESRVASLDGTWVVDGLRFANTYPSFEDYKTFSTHILRKLENKILSIPTDVQEKEKESIEELKMVLNTSGEPEARVVISCASQRRKLDILAHPSLRPSHFNWRGLSWTAIHDPKRFPIKLLAISTIEHIEASSMEEKQEYVVVARLNDRIANLWDQCLAAPLSLVSEFTESGIATPLRNQALCTLSGFVEVEGKIYGLTVAHPLLNAMTESSNRRIRSDKVGNFVVGRVRVCAFSHGSLDTSTNEVTAPPNSDWALINLGDNFDLEELARSQVAAKFTPTANRKLEVWEDADLKPRKVFIMTGFSKKKEGMLSIAELALTIGSSSLNVMRVEVKQPLEPGDSGSFVILDEQVCGTIIAGESSLNWAYVIPITDTLSSISKILGQEAKFPTSNITSAVRMPSSKSGPYISPAKYPRIDRCAPTETVARLNRISTEVLASNTADINPLQPAPLHALHKEEECDKDLDEHAHPHFQQDNASSLPLAFGLISTPPALEAVHLGAVIPDVRQPHIDYQNGNLERSDQTDLVRETIDRKFSVKSPPFMSDQALSFSLSANSRKKLELAQPDQYFHDSFKTEIQEIANRLGTNLFLITGLVTLNNVQYSSVEDVQSLEISNTLESSKNHQADKSGSEQENQLRLESELSGDRVFAVGYRKINLITGQSAHLESTTYWQMLGELGALTTKVV